MTETDEDLNYQRIRWYVVLEHDLIYVTIPNETEDNDEIQWKSSSTLRVDGKNSIDSRLKNLTSSSKIKKKIGNVYRIRHRT